MIRLLESLRKSLRDNASEEVKVAAKRFFKETIDNYGVKLPVVNSLSKQYFIPLKEKSKEEVFDACEELWASGIFEESIVACHWVNRKMKEFIPSDFDTFERWLRRCIHNWASCDTFCNHTVGSIIERYPELVERLTEWARDENRWVRRGAAVSLIIPARKGLFESQILAISDLLLADKDEMVQKGYGWLLKSASQFNPDKIYQYLLSRKDQMPRLSLRHAAEKMPPDRRAEVLKRRLAP